MLELTLREIDEHGARSYHKTWNIREHRNLFLVLWNELGKGSIEATKIDINLKRENDYDLT